MNHNNMESSLSFYPHQYPVYSDRHPCILVAYWCTCKPTNIGNDSKGPSDSLKLEPPSSNSGAHDWIQSSRVLASMH